MNETVFVKKIKHKNFTTVDNGFIRNNSLSWKSKGILLYLISLPDDWILNLNELKNHATDGISSLRAGLNELRLLGYLNISLLKDETGKFTGTKYEVDEYGMLPKQDAHKTNKEPETDKPKLENLKSENLKSENPTLLNTDNNQILNKLNTNKLTSAPDNNSTSESNGASSENITDLINTIAELKRELKNKNEELKDKDILISENNKVIEKMANSKTAVSSKYKNSDYSECLKIINDNKEKLLKAGKDIDSTTYAIPTMKKWIKKQFEYYGVDNTKRGLINSVNYSWLVDSSRYSMSAMFSDKVFPKLISNEVTTNTPKPTYERPVTKAGGIPLRKQNYDEEDF